MACARARRIMRRMPATTFGQYAAVAAIVDDHDRRNPDAPRDGEARVLSIVAHTQRLRLETLTHPERFTAAARRQARADHGRPWCPPWPGSATSGARRGLNPARRAGQRCWGIW